MPVWVEVLERGWEPERLLPLLLDDGGDNFAALLDCNLGDHRDAHDDHLDGCSDHLGCNTY